MFIQPCFIQKCTPALIEKLVELGYKIVGKTTLSYGIFCNNGKIKICSTNEQPSIKDKDFIQCYDNEELFLAVAALRDDTDYMQWFMIPHTKTIPIPGYCGQQGMNGYQRIITSVEYHKYDRKDSHVSDIIKFEKENGETILPRKLNVKELKLWFNHKIMHNPYKDDPNIKCYTNNIRDNITDKKKRDCQGNKKIFSKRK